MKKIITLCLVAAMAMIANPAMADKKTKTSVFKADITCQNCANKILNNVPSLGKGIKDVKVDVDSKLVTVTYNENKNSDANIIKGLASLNVAARTADGAADKGIAPASGCCKVKAAAAACGAKDGKKEGSCCKASQKDGKKSCKKDSKKGKKDASCCQGDAKKSCCSGNKKS